MDCVVYAFRSRDEYDLESRMFFPKKSDKDMEAEFFSSSEPDYFHKKVPVSKNHTSYCTLIRRLEFSYKDFLRLARIQFLSENFFSHVLILLDDVHVASFNPNTLLSLMEGTNLSVLQPLITCSANSV